MPNFSTKNKILCLIGDIFCSFSCMVAKLFVSLHRIPNGTAAKSNKNAENTKQCKT